jgi:hypothetical protein
VSNWVVSGWAAAIGVVAAALNLDY